jgi:formate/nitrite transporter FocA (FNT family)
MSYKPPKAIAKAGIETGATKAKLSWDKALVAGFLAGAYIAFAGLLAFTVTAGMPERIWGTLPSFFTGAVFSLGLILVVIAGSELLTGNMALVPLAAMRGGASFKRLAENWFFVLVGNPLGSLFVAYFLAVKTGVGTAELPLARLEGIATRRRSRRPSCRSSCAASAATGSSASQSGWRWPPRTSPARSSRSSSRSWRSSRWASTTS